ncbi:MAG: UvrD-helicase domain-containing protein [Opitutales bacterium]|nr:UvrD-helicase domain-containing protein [Opitutales bacterium]
MEDILDLSRSGVIEASAGTGKTWTINEIYKSLILGKKYYGADLAEDKKAEKIDPCKVGEILVVTFTNAATAELRERIQSGIEKELGNANLSEEDSVLLRLASMSFDEAHISTIHSFCHEILTQFSTECGLPDRLEIETDISAQREYFAGKYCAAKVLQGGDDFWKTAAELVAGIWKEQEKHLGKLSVGKADGVHSAAKKNYETAMGEGFELWTNFRKRQIIQTATISHDETLRILQEALEKNPAIAREISKRYKVALIDEAQDTDDIQADIFKRIFWENKNSRLFYIGDPKQSIYSFRGGDVKSYEKMREEILSAGTKVFSLGKNFRSTQAIIDGVNRLFKGESEPETSIFTEKFNEFGGNDGKFPVPKCEKGFKEGEAPFDCKKAFYYLDINAEGKLIPMIVRLVREKGVPASRIAVLAKGNETLRKYRKELMKEGVPAVCTGEESVYSTVEAKLFLNLLKGINGDLGAEELNYVYASKLFCGEVADGEGADDDFRERLWEARQIWSKNGILQAIENLDAKYSIYENLARPAGTTEKDPQAVSDFKQVLELTAKEIALNNWGIEQTIESVQKAVTAEDNNGWNKSGGNVEESQLIRLSGGKDAVQLSTIYKSKGLEYDIVFLPDLTEIKYTKKNKPEFKISDDRESLLFKDLNEKEFENLFSRANLQDTACLVYVALTRAKYFCVVFDDSPNDDKKSSYMKDLAKRLRENGDCESWTFGGNASAWGTVDEIAAHLPAIPLEKPKKEAFDYDKILRQNEALRQRRFKDCWGLSSYSGLMKSHEAEASAEEEALSSVHEDSPVADNGNARSRGNGTKGEKKYRREKHTEQIPAGTTFGSEVHSIFEKIDFADPDTGLDSWRDTNGSFKPEVAAIVADMVKKTLELKIAGDKRIRDFDCRRDVRREMEFYLSLASQENFVESMGAALRDSGNGVYQKTYGRFFENKSKFCKKLEGLLTGSIDAVLRDGERYYIVDWKTNIVRSDAFEICESDIEDEIVEHGYALQWLFYAVALRAFLRKSGVYKPGILGGVRYVFVRWQAVYAAEPDDALLDKVEAALGYNVK